VALPSFKQEHYRPASQYDVSVSSNNADCFGRLSNGHAPT